MISGYMQQTMRIMLFTIIQPAQDLINKIRLLTCRPSGYLLIGEKLDFQKIKDNNNKNLKDIDYSIILYIFNYKEWKCKITNIIEYNKLGKKLYSDESVHEWKDIPHNSIIDLLLNNILKQYEIKR
jgi:hypothetical protein